VGRFRKNGRGLGFGRVLTLASTRVQTAVGLLKQLLL
jgi:hypothetical protein